VIIRPILRHTWLEVLRSPLRLTLIVLVLVPGWLFAAITVATGGTLTLQGHHSPPTSGMGFWLALIVGAGLIGRPASNGTLALVLSRPVPRVSYVLTRWLAVAMLASALALLNLAAKGLLGQIPAAAWGHVGFAAAEDVLGVAGAAAILALLSSLVGGLGDVALLAILVLLAGILEKLGGFLSRPALSWAGYHLRNVLVPSLDLETVFRSTPISWLAIVTYLSTVTLCLAAATELMCRREISYAGGGD
jgi:ABC-type transport system involved in multi-copper enzyme maturation permease subunit